MKRAGLSRLVGAFLGGSIVLALTYFWYEFNFSPVAPESVLWHALFRFVVYPVAGLVGILVGAALGTLGGK